MKKAALRRERLLDWGADEGIDDGRCGMGGRVGGGWRGWWGGVGCWRERALIACEPAGGADRRGLTRLR